MNGLVSMILVACLSLLSGCSSLQVIPSPVDGGVINAKEQSQMLTKNGIAITVKNDDAEINSYNLETTVSSFHVRIDNQSTEEVSFDNDSFLLVDNLGRQYFPLTPEKVKEMISRNSYYLIPYPYVGFYYLEDYENYSYVNESSSQLPYFYQLYPQDIYTKALPPGAVIPQANISGLVYFKIDFGDNSSVKFMVYKKGTPKSSPPDFIFPFTIKN